MKQQFTVSVFTENKIGLLNRVSIIFTRRHINIESITASQSEIEGIHRYTIVVNEEEELVRKVVGQLEKQIDINKAFYHANNDMVYQEMALFKVPTKAFANGKTVEQLIRYYHARVLTVEPEFTIIEMTGYEQDILQLFNELEPFGILEFVKSGRVAISRPMKELRDYLAEVEHAAGGQVSNKYELKNN